MAWDVEHEQDNLAPENSDDAAAMDGGDTGSEERESEWDHEHTSSEFDYELPAPGSARPSDEEHVDSCEDGESEDGLDDAPDGDDFNDWEA